MSRRGAAALAIAILVLGGCGRYGPPMPVDRTTVAEAAPEASEESEEEEREGATSESP